MSFLIYKFAIDLTKTRRTAIVIRCLSCMTLSDAKCARLTEFQIIINWNVDEQGGEICVPYSLISAESPYLHVHVAHAGIVFQNFFLESKNMRHIMVIVVECIVNANFAIFVSLTHFLFAHIECVFLNQFDSHVNYLQKFFYLVD